jgi:hypothetical protein
VLLVAHAGHWAIWALYALPVIAVVIALIRTRPSGDEGRANEEDRGGEEGHEH